MTTDTKRIPRVAKGKRPRYFSDPAIDKLHAIVMSLIGELSVTRDRLDALERVLDEKGTVSRDDLEAYVPDAAAEAERRERRAAYIARVMRIIEMELDEVEGRREGDTFESALADLLDPDQDDQASRSSR